MGLEELIERATHLEEQKTVAVAGADDKEIIEAVTMAMEKNIADFLLFGKRENILEEFRAIAPHLLLSNKLKIIDAPSVEESVAQAIETIRMREADVLMKGNVPTATLLKSVLKKENNLRTGNVLSHVAVFQTKVMDRLIFVTDAAMNIAPNLETKVQIIENAVSLFRAICPHAPLVAPLAAVEVINPAMQATVDAAILTQMNRRGQIKHCVIDGPLALDNAISNLAAEQKQINSEVAGRADILLVPSIEVGNVLYKSLVYFAGASVASVIAGAKVPIVLTSRADRAENKLYSLALAILSGK